MYSSIRRNSYGKDDNYSENVNGISIVPKKNSNLLRIWLKDNNLADKDNYNFNLLKTSTLLYKEHS